MAIVSIDVEEFDALNPSRNEMATIFTSEKAWYADTARNIIGTVVFDKTDKDWSYAVLAKHEDGKYRYIDGRVSIEDREEAEDNLFSAMSMMEEEDQAKEKLFEDLKSTEKEEQGSLLVTDINTELKKYFKKHPEKLYELTPRKFEELVASILEDLGFTVELTKATRDGGSDIIVYIKNAVCEYLTLVECKKYSPDRKIGVGIVREVLGVHHLKRASKSLIVTTSFFSQDAQKEARAFEHQLALKDYESIKDWLLRY